MGMLLVWNHHSLIVLPMNIHLVGIKVPKFCAFGLCLLKQLTVLFIFPKQVTRPYSVLPDFKFAVSLRFS